MKDIRKFYISIMRDMAFHNHGLLCLQPMIIYETSVHIEEDRTGLVKAEEHYKWVYEYGITMVPW